MLHYHEEDPDIVGNPIIFQAILHDFDACLWVCTALILIAFHKIFPVSMQEIVEICHELW